MHSKKIRGHKRIWKEIDQWIDFHKELDLDTLENRKRLHSKVYVSPFCDLHLTDGASPRATGKTRKKIINGLLEIFRSWEEALKTLHKPYYLAIWLFDNDIHKSQIVCAIDGCLDFYETTFYRPPINKPFPITNYGNFKDQLKSFNWQYAWDEDYFTNEDIEEDPDDYETLLEYHKRQRWYRRKLKTNARKYIDSATKQQNYFVKNGDIFIGKRNLHL